MKENNVFSTENVLNNFLNGDITEVTESELGIYCFPYNLSPVGGNTKIFLISKLNSLEDNLNDTSLNVLKGLICLLLGKESEAFHYFSFAINNSDSDMAFLLRSKINYSLNPQRYDDAKKAVELNPNALTFYNLATQSTVLEAVDNYSKAIVLNTELESAYVGRVNCYEELKDFDAYLSDAMKCLEIWGKWGDGLDWNVWLSQPLTKISLSKVRHHVEKIRLVLSKESFKGKVSHENKSLICKLILILNTNNKDLIDKVDSAVKDSILMKDFTNEILKIKKYLCEREDKGILVYEAESVIHFGKYENQSISSVIQIDSHYILWCIVNLNHFSIDQNLAMNPDFDKHVIFVKALSMNIAKNEVYYAREEARNYHDYYNDLRDYDAFEGDHASWFNYNQ